MLTRVHLQGEVFTAQTCWISDYEENIKVNASSREEAISTLSKQIALFIESLAREYIDVHSSPSGRINCPQAFILLPIDLWYCKDTRANCSLQGQIDTVNPSNFFSLCTQPEEIKKKIWNTILNGRYKGFHHLPGRYKCALCNKDNINFNYHYPWELTHLADHCNIAEIWKDTKRASRLIIAGLPLSALSSSLCSDCFLKVAKLFPEIKLGEYKIFSYDYCRS